MFCSNCGKEIRATDRFCPSCGAINTAYSESGDNSSLGKKDDDLWDGLSASGQNPNCGYRGYNGYNGDPYQGYNPASTQRQESSVIGVLAIIFSILGGWIGLVLAIVGLCYYKTPSYRKLCKIALGIFIAWVVICVIFVIVIIAVVASAAAAAV